MIRPIKRILKGGLLLSLIFSPAAFADNMPVPAKLQSALFLKILSYDRIVSDASSINIGVLTSGSASVKTELLSSFKELSGQKIGSTSFSLVEVSMGELGNLKGKGINVLYIPPDNKSNLGTISSAAQKAKVLTITGVPDYTEKGNISVAIGIKDNKKPEIIINLPASKAEGRDFSAQILKLAKVIK